MIESFLFQQHGAAESIALDWLQLVKKDNVGGLLDEDLIKEVGRRLAQAVPPNSRVVLFGSRARGTGSAFSDLDVLVIEPAVTDSVSESARLRRVLRGLRVPVDVIVVAAEEARRRSAVRGTLVERALREGNVLVDA